MSLDKLREDWKKRLLYPALGFAVLSLLVIGVMSKQGWLPSTDALTGKKTGWFGAALPANASSSWNPMAAPLPTATPQLSKEYIYAGSRMLAVEDAGANAAPPADLAVWRPSSGTWYVLGGPGSQQTYYQWGNSSDIPVQGDYDGDGKTDFSVYRAATNSSSNSQWYLSNSSTNGSTNNTFYFGSQGDVPAVADFDGDGKTDIAVFRPSNGTWYIQRSSDQTVISLQFGISTDTPAPKDYDGDGKADIAVYRTSEGKFYIWRSSDGTLQTVVLGQANTDTPVPADYDGDGKADCAVRRGNDWIIQRTSDNTTQTVTWQQSGDKAVPNDYDGDGKVDIAVWRESIGYWLIRQSSRIGQSDELRQVQWGSPGDTPVPAFYRR